MSQVLNGEELLHIIIDASLVHLLVDAGTLGNGRHNIMNKVVVVFLICLVVLVSVTIRICEDVVSGEATRMLDDDVSITIIKRLKNGIILFEPVHAAVELTIIKGAPHVFFDPGWSTTILNIWTFV
jgi:hypothetical protein